MLFCTNLSSRGKINLGKVNKFYFSWIIYNINTNLCLCFFISMQGFLSVFEIIQPRFILNFAAGVCSLTQTLSLNYKPHPHPPKKFRNVVVNIQLWQACFICSLQGISWTLTLLTVGCRSSCVTTVYSLSSVDARQVAETKPGSFVRVKNLKDRDLIFISETGNLQTSSAPPFIITCLQLSHYACQYGKSNSLCLQWILFGVYFI